ncbi:MAG: magnesium transporter [Gaiellales bacterium]|nr:magnesium transporter [Gaiellales bacterium]
MCHLVDRHGGGEVTLTLDEIERRLDAGAFFWLDIHRPTDEQFQLLREGFGFHELALEDSEDFGQRAKIEDYDDFIFLVVYGASPDNDRLVEVHCFYSERFLVTVHRDDCPAFAEARRRQRDIDAYERPAVVLYRVVDALVDSFFPVLSDFDDRIDDLEEGIFRKADDAQLQEIFRLKRLLVGIRKALTPQRDMFAGFAAGTVEIPGFATDDRRYFRDVYDHLIRLTEVVDAYRDLLTGTMDVYLSTVSNRLNSVMKQLAIIATIFLPLTWITGFFGQNFGWEVRHIGGLQSFAFLGIGLEVAAVAWMLVYFKRRGWF